MIPQIELYDLYHKFVITNKENELTKTLIDEMLTSSNYYYTNISDDYLYDYVIDDIYYDKLLEYYKKKYGIDKEEILLPKGRLVKIPLWLGSMTKIHHDSGDLTIWKNQYPKNYLLSAKLDGASSLYCNMDGIYYLFSRGKNGLSQNISNMLLHLKLPKINVNEFVRGELIVKKSNFLKYQNKYKKCRNAVAGAVNFYGSKDYNTKEIHDLIHDIEFIAYEYMYKINDKPKNQDFINVSTLIISEQYDKLKEYGFNIPIYQTIININYDILSKIYDNYIEEYNYDIDGIIICTMDLYDRNIIENPPYARAYKKQLTNLFGITYVKNVEYKKSRFNYMKPTLNIDPIVIDGTLISRVSAHNCRYILDNGIGKGSKIEIIKSGSIIPKITKIIEKVKPDLPNLLSGEYIWNETGVDIICNPDYDFDDSDSSSTSSTSTSNSSNGNNVVSIYHFLSTIGVKGIGETTVKTIYDNGINTLGDFLTMKQSDIIYLGPKISENIITGIKNSLDTASLITLIYASSTLGRGIGKKKIEEIFDMYPNFLDIMKEENNKEKIINMLIQVKGIAHKTASTITSNIDKMFLYFKNNNINIDKYHKTINITINQNQNHGNKFINFIVCMSGFRDEEIKNIVETNGGKISLTMTKSVNLLLVKNKESITTKVQKAIDDGIRIMTKDEFLTFYK